MFHLGGTSGWEVGVETANSAWCSCWPPGYDVHRHGWAAPGPAVHQGTAQAAGLVAKKLPEFAGGCAPVVVFLPPGGERWGWRVTAPQRHMEGERERCPARALGQQRGSRSPLRMQHHVTLALGHSYLSLLLACCE